MQARITGTVAHVESLAATDPGWGSGVQPVAGGWLVLSGAGLYVNRALGAGVEPPLSPADLELIVAESEAAAVVPAVEVTPSTHPETRQLLRETDFAHDPASDVALLARPVDGSFGEGPDDVVMCPVETEADLLLWQTTSAIGWGHKASDARRASDAFAAAANAMDNEHLVVATDPFDGRPVGCASVTIRDGVAMLGGMSTVPAERRRGVQAALLRYRLGVAAHLGCDLAATSATSGGASERNLRRHGFVPQLVVETHTRSVVDR